MPVLLPVAPGRAPGPDAPDEALPLPLPPLRPQGGVRTRCPDPPSAQDRPRRRRGAGRRGDGGRQGRLEPRHHAGREGLRGPPVHALLQERRHARRRPLLGVRPRHPVLLKRLGAGRGLRGGVLRLHPQRRRVRRERPDALRPPEGHLHQGPDPPRPQRLGGHRRQGPGRRLPRRPRGGRGGRGRDEAAAGPGHRGRRARQGAPGGGPAPPPPSENAPPC